MSSMFHGDCLHWLDERPEASFEAIITDPPYGLKEYSPQRANKIKEWEPWRYLAYTALAGRKCSRASSTLYRSQSTGPGKSLYIFFYLGD